MRDRAKNDEGAFCQDRHFGWLTGNPSLTRFDKWETAADREEEARDQAKAAKKAYESALRQEYFNF